MKDTSCIFCKIANGTIPSYKVYEDSDVIAFLDVNPASRGHTLVVTKEHFSNMTTCPKAILDKVFEVAQTIAQAQIAQLGATGVNVLTNVGESAGQSVHHFHVHVIPRYDNDGLKLAFPPKQLADSEMTDIKTSIEKAL
ncbi:MAG: HIT family protein [Bacilli bacterium]|nr:HIT family protein [Bacilli bacterium]